MASPGKDNYRMKSYKNHALNSQEMRRRREEEGIQLRKQKREEQVDATQERHHVYCEGLLVDFFFFFQLSLKLNREKYHISYIIFGPMSY